MSRKAEIIKEILVGIGIMGGVVFVSIVAPNLFTVFSSKYKPKRKYNNTQVKRSLNRLETNGMVRMSEKDGQVKISLTKKGQKKTIDALKAEWRPQAERNVRMELGLSEIARNENVSISDQELQAEIDKIQDAKVKQQFEQQEPRLQLRHALRQTRTLDLLKKLVAG